jgi:release factor glutamine methyltransferase
LSTQKITANVSTACLITENTIGNVIKQATPLLQPHSDSAKLDAQLLLAYVLNKPLSYLLTWPEQQLIENTINEFSILLAKRIKGEPIAYLVGEKEFWSLPLKVSPATLIPRADTEILVEQVLHDFADKKGPVTCLDLGTGTGAIALAIASEKQHWHIEAVDFSHEAVALAQDNAKQLSLPQVSIYQSDWFSNISPDTQFDVIVSNPPYIDETDLHLSKGDVRFEPKSALVASNQGLADIQKIAEQARTYLKPNGVLYFEHGYQQADAVTMILTVLGYQDIKTIQDLSGNDRVTSASYII